jgi:hypothetical protein
MPAKTETTKAAETETPVIPSSLIGRMAAIMGEMHQLNKSGRNKFFSYDYVTDGDLLEPLRKIMSKYGVVCYVEVLGETRTEHSTKQGMSTLTKLDMNMTLACDTGERSFAWIGYGDDSGDKGAYKAMTGGLKTFLMKQLALSGDEDPERDDEDKTPSPRGKPQAPNDASGDPRPVQVQQSTVTKPVAKGGKASGSTGAQVNAIATECKRLSLTLEDLISLSKTLTGKGADLGPSNTPEEKQAQLTVVRSYFSGLTGEEAGRILSMLEDTKVAGKPEPEAEAAQDDAPDADDAASWPQEDAQ